MPFGAVRNSGQACSLKTRLLVPRSRKNEIIDAVVSVVESMTVGDPADPDTHTGPMASKRQQARVASFIERGLAEGGRPVLGGAGTPPALNRGWFVRPTIFADVAPGATIAQVEIWSRTLCLCVRRRR